MIETKTLLIVGAGASVPYGYPTGKELRDELCDPDQLADLARSYFRVDERGLTLFCEQFLASQLLSIDAFLAKRGDDHIGIQSSYLCQTFGTFADCGKFAIANRLIKRESLINLLEPEEDHWLQYLWNHMNDVVKTEFQNNQLKIISFNYDRVIEQYFQTAILNSYGIAHKEAAELQKSIDIVHVYGDLQDLEERPYGVKPKDIEKVAACIRVIPESREAHDNQFNRAKEMITWAEKICFIGFGFDSTNISRLGFPDHNLSSKKVYSTLYGVTLPEIFVAQKRLGGDFYGSEIDWLNHSIHKTLDYIRNTGALLSL